MPAVTAARLAAAAMRASYYEFFVRAWPVVVRDAFVPSWYIRLGCDEVQTAYERVFAGEPAEYTLITNQPPGTTKSLIHSVMPFAWGLTRMPHLRFLGASHGADLAEKLSMLCRDVVKSDWYRQHFPTVRVRPDMDARAHWMTTAGGERVAVGSRAAPTGRVHAHVISLDDLIDPEAALSEAELYHANHWMVHTLLNRKADARVTFVDFVAQRLCQGDQTDELAAVAAPHVRHVVLPADADYPVRPPELISNYVDGLLDPVRKPATALEAEKKKGEVYYAGQFGQQPVPPGGGTFKTAMLRWAREPGPGEWRYRGRFWDKAVSTRKARRAAYTVGVAGGEDAAGRFWITDVARFRADTFARERRIRATAVRDGPGVVIGIEQEPGSAGADSVVASMKRLSDLGRHGRRRVRAVRASSSKEVRAEEFSVAVNGGWVYLPERMRRGNEWVGWAKDFVDELRYWPNGTALDQGDAAAGLYNMARRPGVRVGPVRRKKKRPA